MTRACNQTPPVLLDPDAWEAPFRLSDEDLYAEAGAYRRAGGRAPDDREDER